MTFRSTFLSYVRLRILPSSFTSLQFRINDALSPLLSAYEPKKTKKETENKNKKTAVIVSDRSTCMHGMGSITFTDRSITFAFTCHHFMLSFVYHQSVLYLDHFSLVTVTSRAQFLFFVIHPVLWMCTSVMQVLINEMINPNPVILWCSMPYTEAHSELCVATR